MSGLHRNPRLRFGRTRGRQRCAVVALNGADPSELGVAQRWAEPRGERALRVAVDGGIAAWRARRRRPDLFVGDGDSGAPPKGVESILYEPDKGFSDLSGALMEIAKRNVRLVAVAGLIGGRLDHEWINLAELAQAAPMFDGLVAPTARGWVIVTASRCQLETIPGKPFSLLSLGPPEPLTLHGARWRLSNERLSVPSHGLSNITGRQLELSLADGCAALLFPNVEE
jgi:thiamine pyrophosphokinase